MMSSSHWCAVLPALATYFVHHCYAQLDREKLTYYEVPNEVFNKNFYRHSRDYKEQPAQQITVPTGCIAAEGDFVSVGENDVAFANSFSSLRTKFVDSKTKVELQLPNKSVPRYFEPNSSRPYGVAYKYVSIEQGRLCQRNGEGYVNVKLTQRNTSVRMSAAEEAVVWINTVFQQCACEYKRGKYDVNCDPESDSKVDYAPIPIRSPRSRQPESLASNVRSNTHHAESRKRKVHPTSSMAGPDSVGVKSSREHGEGVQSVASVLQSGPASQLPSQGRSTRRRSDPQDAQLISAVGPRDSVDSQPLITSSDEGLVIAKEGPTVRMVDLRTKETSGSEDSGFDGDSEEGDDSEVSRRKGVIPIKRRPIDEDADAGPASADIPEQGRFRVIHHVLGAKDVKDGVQAQEINPVEVSGMAHDNMRGDFQEANDSLSRSRSGSLSGTESGTQSVTQSESGDESDDESESESYDDEGDD